MPASFVMQATSASRAVRVLGVAQRDLARGLDALVLGRRRVPGAVVVLDRHAQDVAGREAREPGRAGVLDRRGRRRGRRSGRGGWGAARPAGARPRTAPGSRCRCRAPARPRRRRPRPRASSARSGRSRRRAGSRRTRSRRGRSRRCSRPDRHRRATARRPRRPPARPHAARRGRRRFPGTRSRRCAGGGSLGHDLWPSTTTS